MMLGIILLTLSLTGCALFHKRDTTTLRIHEQVSSALPPQNARTVEIPLADLKLTVSPFPILSERNVLDAVLHPTAGGDAILVRFDIHGVMVLDEATVRGRGQYLVTFIDNRAVAAWLINQHILNGQLLIEGDFSDDEAARVVAALNKIGKANTRR